MEPKKQFPCRLIAIRPETVVRATPDEGRLVARHVAYLKPLTGWRAVLLVGRSQSHDPTGFGNASSSQAPRWWPAES